MKGVLTQSGFLAMAMEARTDKTACFARGLVAGYYSIENNCNMDNVHCADGILAGIELRKALLSFDGKTTDEDVKQSIGKIFDPDNQEEVPVEIFENSGRVEKVLQLRGGRVWAETLASPPTLPAF